MRKKTNKVATAPEYTEQWITVPERHTRQPSEVSPSSSKRQTRSTPVVSVENNKRPDILVPSPTSRNQLPGFVPAGQFMKERQRETKSPKSYTKDGNWISPKSQKRPGSKEIDNLFTNKRPRICSPSLSSKKEQQYIPKRQSPIINTSMTTPRRFGCGFGGPSSSGQGYRKYEEYENFEEKSQDKLYLKYLDLPPAILHRYSLRGVRSLFRWQFDCLSNPKVLLDRKNLLYSAPTTSGKTLVAEILMLKCVLERNKKAIMILPYNAVAQEKTAALHDIFGSYNIRVGGFFGSKSPIGGFNAVDIACCTIERANIIFNKLVEENSLSELGIIVVDEFHQICEPGRGHLIELLLTKIKYMKQKKLENENQKDTNDAEVDIQVVGMSATFETGSFSSLCDWLNAELYLTTYRPIPLKERFHLKNKIYDAKSGNFVRTVKKREDLIVESLEISDDENVILMTLETVLEGKSCLIFCNTKKGCEQLAQKIARTFRYVGNSGPDDEKTELRNQLNTEKITSLVSHLEEFGVEQSLVFPCSLGVAYHHAGLSTEERTQIESAFKKGTIRVICATTTLSAGVNLPAGRVIIQSPVACRSIPLNPLVYQQMCGRSGRVGLDNQGESILICDNFEKIGKNLVKATLPKVKSSLLGESGKIELTKAMKKVILESIALGMTKTLADVYIFARATLLNAVDERVNQGLKNPGNEKNIITDCIDFLVEKQFVQLISFQDENNETTCEYKSTRLGEACLASGFSPDTGLCVLAELEKAQECFVLSTDLHLIYQITPLPEEDLEIDYLLQYHKIWSNLNEKEQKVGGLVGVSEAFITNGGSTLKNKRNGKKAAIHQRFYTALVLSDLVKEMPINDIAVKYSLDKGFVQNLQKNAGSTTNRIISFCNRLGWSSLEVLLKQFEERLELGVQKELLDLLKLSTIDKQKARFLYDSNIKNLDDLALTDIGQLEKIIHASNPFQREKKNEKKLQLSSRQEAQILITDTRSFLETREPERFKALKSSLINRNNKIPINNVQIATSDSTNTNSKSTEESQSQPQKSYTNSVQQLSENNNEHNKVNTGTSNISTTTTTTRTTKEDDDGVVLDDSETDFEEGDDDETDYNEDTDVEEVPATSSSSSSGICTSGSTTGGTPRKISQQQQLENEVPKNMNSTSSSSRALQIPLVQHINSIDSLPVNFFENEKLISLGIKLALSSHQTQLTSGIGSRLLRKFNLTKTKGDSLILFDGGAIIWELSVDLKEETAVVNSIFEKIYNYQCQISFWNAKETLAKLYDSYANAVVEKILSSKNSLVSTKKIYDPKIAQWLYHKWDNPDHKDDDNFIQDFLIEQHFDTSQIKIIDNSTWTHEVIKETFLSFQFMEKLRQKLIETKLWEHFIEIEMPSVFPVLLMELKGFKFDLKELEKLKKSLMFKSAVLELKCFVLANRQFDLHSLQEIKQILFKELKLRQPKNTTGVNKNVLSKLNHELPKTIREWRKVENTLQKVLPFEHDVSSISGRVKGVYSFFTVNNRLAMITEPSLQCISNDFELKSSFSLSEIESIVRGVGNLQSFDSKIEELVNIVNDGLENEEIVREESTFPISLRSAFKSSSKNHIILSADYSQLELRILAHFSKDENLLDALKCGDVISSIAAKMKSIPVSEVTKDLRQAAKQVIYGIIYGIGKTQLALKLEVTENIAIEFEDSLLEAFPKIREYLESSKNFCEQHGYIETIVGRKRLIHNMNSKSSQLRSRAMRQAVNSRIQGSASDVMKKAMTEIHEFILQHYSNTDKIFPVLNLHDELLYEVELSELKYFASNVRRIMESSLTEVPLPVNIKVGDSWSNLQPYHLK